MTRAAWTDLAVELADLRRRLQARAAKSGRRRSAFLAQVVGVELAVRSVCAVLKARSTRFDSRRFMKLARGAAK